MHSKNKKSKKIKSPDVLISSKIDYEGKNSYFGIALLSFGIIILYFYSLYHLPVFQIICFLIGVIIFLYLPGLFVLDLLDWKDNSLSLILLSVLTGMALSPILYYLASFIGQIWLFLVIIICVSAYAIYKILWLQIKKCNIKMPNGWWKLFIVLSIILTVLHFSHFSDLKILQAGGYKLRISSLTESIYHLGIINAAEYNIPPVFPYASGYKLSEYHIDMHVLAVIFCKFLKIDPAIMTFYFLPFLLMSMIIVVPAAFFYELHKDINLGFLLGVLMLGADFSFIPASWKDWPSFYPWTLTFCTTIWSLFTINGIMAAIPLFWGSALVLQRFYKTQNVKNLILFSVFTIASYRMKNSMGLQLIGVSFLFLVFNEWRFRTGIFWKAFPVMIITSGIILIDFFIKSLLYVGNTMVRVMPFNGLLQSATYLNINQWHNAAMSPLQYPLTLLLALLLYFVGFMGVRIIFLKYFYDVINFRKTIEPIVPFFILFIITGVFLPDIIYLGSNDYNINNAVWFRVQSISAATFFVIEYIYSIKSRFHKTVLICLVVLLSFPTTLNFLKLRYANEYTEISVNQLLAADYIKMSVPGNAVILEYPHLNVPSLSSNLAGRSTILTYYMSFLRSKLDQQSIASRNNDIRSFFMFNDEKNRMMILKKYGAEYLIIPSQFNSSFSKYSWLVNCYNNPEVIIYKVNIY